MVTILGPMKRLFFFRILLAGCAGNSSFTIHANWLQPFARVEERLEELLR